MINSEKKIKNINVVNDEGLNLKLALSKDGSR